MNAKVAIDGHHAKLCKGSSPIRWMVWLWVRVPLDSIFPAVEFPGLSTAHYWKTSLYTVSCPEGRMLTLFVVPLTLAALVVMDQLIGELRFVVC